MSLIESLIEDIENKLLEPKAFYNLIEKIPDANVSEIPCYIDAMGKRLNQLNLQKVINDFSLKEQLTSLDGVKEGDEFILVWIAGSYHSPYYNKYHVSHISITKATTSGLWTTDMKWGTTASLFLEWNIIEDDAIEKHIGKGYQGYVDGLNKAIHICKEFLCENGVWRMEDIYKRQQFKFYPILIKD